MYFILILGLVNLTLLFFIVFPLLLLPVILLMWKYLLLYIILFVIVRLGTKFAERFKEEKNSIEEFLIKYILTVDFAINILGILLFNITIAILMQLPLINKKQLDLFKFLMNLSFLFPSLLLFFYRFISPKTRLTILLLNIFSSSLLIGLIISLS